MARKRILITGACGLIGGIVYNHLRQFPDDYEVHALARSRQPRRKGAQMAENWVSEIPDSRFHLTDLTNFDGVQKAVAGIDVFYAVSNNERRWMDIEHAREVIGYMPQDRAEDYLQAQKSEKQERCTNG